MIELGVTIPSGGDDFSRERMMLVAELARELGYQHVWAGEHLVADSATADRGKSLDPFVSLAWVASRVEGIGIGTSIVLLPMRHPFRVAREAGTLQLLSDGRFNLGIGVGWNEAEFRLAGYGFHGRGERADEALRVIETLWSGRTSFRGEFWSFDDACFYPRPDPPPQIWIGGNSPRALARARRHGNVWHPNGLPDEAFALLKDGWAAGSCRGFRSSSTARSATRTRSPEAKRLSRLGSTGHSPPAPTGSCSALRTPTTVWPRCAALPTRLRRAFE